MPYGFKSGMGSLTQAEYAACNAQFLRGILNPYCWQYVDPASTVATVDSPTGSALTVAPASGADAEATITGLVNQQVVDQNALNAGTVTSSVTDQAASAVVDTSTAVGDVVSSAADSITSGLSSALPWILGGVGLLVFGMVAMGGGSARRYGR